MSLDLAPEEALHSFVDRADGQRGRLCVPPCH